MPETHGEDRTRRRVVAAALLITGLAALVPVGGQIYGDIYPGAASTDVVPEAPTTECVFDEDAKIPIDGGYRWEGWIGIVTPGTATHSYDVVDNAIGRSDHRQLLGGYDFDVTAVPNSGTVFADGAETSWTFTGTNTCESVVLGAAGTVPVEPPPPTYLPATGVADDAPRRPGSGVVQASDPDAGSKIDEASASAELRHSFSTDTIVQNVLFELDVELIPFADLTPTEVAAVDPNREVQFAEFTQVRVRSDCDPTGPDEDPIAKTERRAARCQFDVVNDGWQTQPDTNLNWTFDITPRTWGNDLTVFVDVQPIIQFLGDGTQQNAGITLQKTIEIPVGVHPSQTALNAAYRTAQDALDIELPETVEVDQPFDVTATLELPDTFDPDTVTIDVDLTPQGQLAAIANPTTNITGQTFTWTWTVTPTTEGALRLQFDGTATAQIGDDDETLDWSTTRDIVVEPPPPPTTTTTTPVGIVEQVGDTVVEEGTSLIRIALGAIVAGLAALVTPAIVKRHKKNKNRDNNPNTDNNQTPNEDYT